MEHMITAWLVSGFCLWGLSQSKFSVHLNKKKFVVVTAIYVLLLPIRRNRHVEDRMLHGNFVEKKIFIVLVLLRLWFSMR